MEKKYLVLAAFALVSCSEKWNDIAHEEVVAVIDDFAVENQEKCVIDKIEKTIALTLPYDADPSAAVVTQFTVTEGARCTPAIKVGDRIDVSSPLTLTLRTYDDYTWTVTATVKPKPTSDIYNMDFDEWSKDFFGLDVPYGDGADSEEKAVWGPAGFLMALATGGSPVLSMETDTVAVKGEGKAAVKLQSLYSDALPALVNGTVFSGAMISFESNILHAKLGVPFKKRPVSMDGYALYKPKVIDHTAEPYTDKAGTLDNAYVFFALADWDSQYEVSPPAMIMEGIDTIPGIIGYGKATFDRQTDNFEKFSIKIDYLNSNTPKYAVILAGSSALGDFGTGAAGSVLFLDELGFVYE